MLTLSDKLNQIADKIIEIEREHHGDKARCDDVVLVIHRDLLYQIKEVDNYDETLAPVVDDYLANGFAKDKDQALRHIMKELLHEVFEQKGFPVISGRQSDFIKNKMHGVK